MQFNVEPVDHLNDQRGELATAEAITPDFSATLKKPPDVAPTTSSGLT